ncbi:AmmeMemoRadiSam system protein B [Candidatus Fermentibacteria bacterium]|nr:AmmeMemoRadiSam system protein B [Candidatus Fermentibacteria bacterium]
METLPTLRTDIQLVQAQYQGRMVIAVKDGLSPQDDVILLNAETAPLLSLFDGRHSMRDLQLALMRAGGHRIVLESEVRALVQELDRRLLLQTERYAARLVEAKTEFAALAVRPPALAGTAYPADRAGVADMIERMVPTGGDHTPNGLTVRGIVAPHINLSVGARTYGKIYSLIRGMTPSRLVVLGTGHALEQGLFSVSSKAYETPLGGFANDTEAVQRLRQVGPPALAPDDFAHRIEHSIEFQVLFLRHVIPGPVPLVPILCGSVSEWLSRVIHPAEIPGVAAFVEVLGEIVDEQTLVIAGVDLSHIGPKFGDDAPASVIEAQSRGHDERLLEALCAGSVEELWREAREVGDRYNVCGLSTLALLMQLFPDMHGRVIDYHIWHEGATRSAVSFAGVAFS